MIYKLLEAKHPLVHTEMPEFDDAEDFNRKEFSDDMGADGDGKDALACVQLAKTLLEVEVNS